MNNRANLTKPHPAEGRTREIGCPWHGFLEKGEILDAPGGTTKKSLPAWPQYAAIDGGGSTNLLKVPGLPEVTRTAEEQAQDAITGHEWRNYALIAGRTLHGKDIGDHIIYIDPAGTPWMILIKSKYTITPSEGWTVTATLKRIFGRFADEPYPVVDREIGVLYSTDLALRTGYAVDRIETGPWVIEQNTTGSVAMIHVPIVGEGDIDIGVNETANSIKMEIAGIFKVEVTGTGDTDRDNLGDGIEATVSLYKTGDDCYYSVTAPGLVGEYPTSGTVNSYLYFTGRQISSTPSECPVCPDVTTEYDRISTPPAMSAYSEDVPHIHRILRVCFDADDNEVIYTSEAYGSVAPDNFAFPFTSDYLRTTVSEMVPVQGEGSCSCVWNSYISDTSTGTTFVEVTWDIIAEDTLILRRNGTEVSRGSKGRTRHMRDAWHSVTGREFANETGATVTVDGEAIPAGLVDTYMQSMVQAYSPQIMGAKARSTGIVPGKNQWSKIYTVATPWGSDSTHNGVWLTSNDTDPIRYLYGTHDPVAETVCWNLPGTTDQSDTEINFI